MAGRPKGIPSPVELELMSLIVQERSGREVEDLYEELDRSALAVQLIS